jgi:hypothetical protein
LVPTTIGFSGLVIISGFADWDLAVFAFGVELGETDGFAFVMFAAADAFCGA